MSASGLLNYTGSCLVVEIDAFIIYNLFLHMHAAFTNSNLLLVLQSSSTGNLFMVGSSSPVYRNEQHLIMLLIACEGHHGVAVVLLGMNQCCWFSPLLTSSLSRDSGWVFLFVFVLRTWRVV